VRVWNTKVYIKKGEIRKRDKKKEREREIEGTHGWYDITNARVNPFSLIFRVCCINVCCKKRVLLFRIIVIINMRYFFVLRACAMPTSFVLWFGFKQNSLSFSFFCCENKFAVEKTLLSLIIFSLSPLRLHSSERRQRALKEWYIHNTHTHTHTTATARRETGVVVERTAISSTQPKEKKKRERDGFVVE